MNSKACVMPTRDLQGASNGTAIYKVGWIHTSITCVTLSGHSSMIFQSRFNGGEAFQGATKVPDQLQGT